MLNVISIISDLFMVFCLVAVGALGFFVGGPEGLLEKQVSAVLKVAS